MSHSYDDAIAAAKEALNAATNTLKSALRSANTPSQPCEAATQNANLKTHVRAGGFVLAGMDAAGYHLLETSAGVQALYVLSHVGRITGHGCEPVYLNQRFFDSLMDE